jgi:tetratricopeptide (TPR) repeat protein
MVRFARWFLLIFPAFFASAAWAQTPSPRVEPASRREARTSPIASVSQQLFGAIPLSTKAEDVRKSLEQAWDRYENAMYDASADEARRATQRDPKSAIAYAMISFAARRTTPDLDALAKAKSLISFATPDEQLLVRWMTGIQDRDLLPAIASMNDLRKRFPRDKHILYVTGEWLFIQQDDDHARSMLETALQIDPNFPAALNRLGYLYIRSGSPDPAKALASLRRYAEVEKRSNNPEDSLGEVSRIAGDDQASLQHYAASLRINPSFLASQEGLGDTRTLMGDFDGARKEYDRALQMATSPVDELYIKQQKALVSFWEGKPEQGRQALAAFAEEAANKKEPNGQFNIALSQAILAPDAKSELKQLQALSAFLEKPLAGMLESDRGIDRATVLRERVRIASLQGQSGEAAQAISELEGLAKASRDQLVEACYESARGYVLAAQNNLADAAEELAADPHSPLALQLLAAIQEKLGNAAAAQSTRTLLKYQRGPYVEWFLATHSSGQSN